MSDSTGWARDRDATGRARNARPRDELGRPLPHGAPGADRVPDDLALPPDEALIEAQRLLDAGRPFHAHEALEGSWKAAEAPERELWRGLAELAVGLTHALRGNAGGASRLLARAANRIEPYGSAPPYGIDAAGLVPLGCPRCPPGSSRTACPPSLRTSSRPGYDSTPEPSRSGGVRSAWFGTDHPHGSSGLTQALQLADDVLHRHRPAEVEALAGVAAHLDQRQPLLGGLHALGDHPEVELAAQVDDGPDDRRGLLRLGHLRHEGAVDLHLVDRDPGEEGQRRVAGAEVVDGEAARPSARSSAQHLVGDAAAGSAPPSR